MQNAEFDRRVAEDARHIIALLNNLLESVAKAGLRCEVNVDRHPQFAVDFDRVNGRCENLARGEMSVLSRITAWLSGEDSETDDEAGESEAGDCQRGGHHEWKDFNAATCRKPLFTYCTRCGEQRAEPKAAS